VLSGLALRVHRNLIALAAIVGVLPVFALARTMASERWIRGILLAVSVMRMSAESTPTRKIIVRYQFRKVRTFLPWHEAVYFHAF